MNDDRPQTLSIDPQSPTNQSGAGTPGATEFYPRYSSGRVASHSSDQSSNASAAARREVPHLSANRSRTSGSGDDSHLRSSRSRSRSRSHTSRSGNTHSHREFGCFRCGAPGHRAVDCASASATPAGDSAHTAFLQYRAAQRDRAIKARSRAQHALIQQATGLDATSAAIIADNAARAAGEPSEDELNGVQGEATADGEEPEDDDEDEVVVPVSANIARSRAPRVHQWYEQQLRWAATFMLALYDEVLRPGARWVVGWRKERRWQHSWLTQVARATLYVERWVPRSWLPSYTYCALRWAPLAERRLEVLKRRAEQRGLEQQPSLLRRLLLALTDPTAYTKLRAWRARVMDRVRADVGEFPAQPADGDLPELVAQVHLCDYFRQPCASLQLSAILYPRLLEWAFHPLQSWRRWQAAERAQPYYAMDHACIIDARQWSDTVVARLPYVRADDEASMASFRKLVDFEFPVRKGMSTAEVHRVASTKQRWNALAETGIFREVAAARRSLSAGRRLAPFALDAAAFDRAPRLE